MEVTLINIKLQYFFQIIFNSCVIGEKYVPIHIQVPAPVVTVNANQDRDSMIREYKKHHNLIMGSFPRYILWKDG